MKGKTKVIIFIVVVIMLVCILLERFYFLGIWNVHAYKGVMRYLKYHYADERFEVTDKKYERIKLDDGSYVHVYSLDLNDGEFSFKAYQCFHSYKRINGSFMEDDYYSDIRDDNFRNILKRECSLDLSKYETDFYEAAINGEPDYVFTINESNVDEIKQALFEILSITEEKNYRLDLWCDVCDGDKTIISGIDAIIQAYHNGETTNGSLKEFVSNYVDKARTK